ncbi:hypothetical protein MTO96_018933 [Rhipicephalus appendiculatus]
MEPDAKTSTLSSRVRVRERRRFSRPVAEARQTSETRPSSLREAQPPLTGAEHNGMEVEAAAELRPIGRQTDDRSPNHARRRSTEALAATVSKPTGPLRRISEQ